MKIRAGGNFTLEFCGTVSATIWSAQNGSHLKRRGKNVVVKNVVYRVKRLDRKGSELKCRERMPRRIFHEDSRHDVFV